MFHRRNPIPALSCLVYGGLEHICLPQHRGRCPSVQGRRRGFQRGAPGGRARLGLHTRPPSGSGVRARPQGAPRTAGLVTCTPFPASPVGGEGTVGGGPARGLTRISRLSSPGAPGSGLGLCARGGLGRSSRQRYESLAWDPSCCWRNRAFVSPKVLTARRAQSHSSQCLMGGRSHWIGHHWVTEFSLPVGSPRTPSRSWLPWAPRRLAGEKTGLHYPPCAMNTLVGPRGKSHPQHDDVGTAAPGPGGWRRRGGLRVTSRGGHRDPEARDPRA